MSQLTDHIFYLHDDLVEEVREWIEDDEEAEGSMEFRYEDWPVDGMLVSTWNTKVATKFKLVWAHAIIQERHEPVRINFDKLKERQ